MRELHIHDQRGASDESLVELLKHPACVGLMREAVLRELGRQHGRSFRSVWDAVAWLQEHRPDIDLNSPPRIAREPLPGDEPPTTLTNPTVAGQ